MPSFVEYSLLHLIWEGADSHVVPIEIWDKMAVSGQVTWRPWAVALIPSSVVVGICEGASLHWKTPYSQSQRVVTFSKRKLWQTHHCISNCIKMRVDLGYICFKSGSPSYI